MPTPRARPKTPIPNNNLFIFFLSFSCSFVTVATLEYSVKP
jgi:hypothetical protein